MPASLLDLSVYTSLEISRALAQDARYKFQPILTKFFSKFYQSPTDSIAYEKIYSNRGTAPLVISNAVGVATKRSKSEIIAYPTAYVKLRDTIETSVVMSRTAGEALLGSLTPQERMDINLRELGLEHVLRIRRLQEAMAAEILLTGKLVLEGDYFPKTTLDFQRDPAKTVVLTGTKLWNTATATPMADLESWISSSKRVIKAVVFSQVAWDNFKKDAKFLQYSNKNYAGEVSAFAKSIIQFDDTAENDIVFVGMLPNSGVNLFVYKGSYTKLDGTDSDYIPQGSLVGIPSPDLGVEAYGAIKDFEASYAAVPHFHKVWSDKDVGAPIMLTQSAPVLLHLDANGTFSAKVV